MKAQFINENIEFKRGIGSKSSLNVGEEKLRQDWWEEFKNGPAPLQQFEIMMLGYIKENTDFTDSWAQMSSGDDIPGKITYVLARPHPANKQLLYLSIDEEGEITRANGVRKMGNIKDLLFSEGREEFIEEIKDLDDYYEG